MAEVAGSIPRAVHHVKAVATAVVAALAVVGFVAWRRASAGGASDEPDAPAKGPCEKLGLTGSALDACKVAEKLWSALPDGIGKQNEKLNGPCARRWHRDQIALLRPYAGSAVGNGLSAVQDSCLEYYNGCVPSPTHPAWKKCAKGTKPFYLDSDAIGGAAFADASQLGEGVDGMPEGGDYGDVYAAADPSTFRQPDSTFRDHGCNRPDGSRGQRGWLAGKPKCCKYGDCTK